MLILRIAAILFFARDLAMGQTGSEGEGDPAGPVCGGVVDSSAWLSGETDSISLALAMIDLAKAREVLASTDFWHRLIPQVTIAGSLGMRDIAFPESGGALLLPRDSYRLTVTLSLSGILDGSKHALGEIQLAESGLRYALLLRTQVTARRALESRKRELLARLAALRREMDVRRSLASYQEFLFARGNADFRAVAQAKIELIRAGASAASLEAECREIDRAVGREPPR